MWIVEGDYKGLSLFSSHVYGEMYGPLPRKRWVPVKGEKRHKLSYKPSKAYKAECSPKAYNEHMAIKYALWLAERDGLSIPEGCRAVAQWSTIYSHTQRDKRGELKHLPRICTVVWREVLVRASFYKPEKLGDVLLTIDIPHWDWEPRGPVEQLLDNEVTTILIALEAA